ncbi:MAG: uncharacterized protein A8A55_1841 [Amphiamblys sp. WSBS2006]|nr:MAG: uncharacterized protein A8A55_1841 [Amphiamblys sp. WSBS2006]
MFADTDPKEKAKEISAGKRCDILADTLEGRHSDAGNSLAAKLVLGMQSRAFTPEEKRLVLSVREAFEEKVSLFKQQLADSFNIPGISKTLESLLEHIKTKKRRVAEGEKRYRLLVEEKIQEERTAAEQLCAFVTACNRTVDRFTLGAGAKRTQAHTHYLSLAAETLLLKIKLMKAETCLEKQMEGCVHTLLQRRLALQEAQKKEHEKNRKKRERVRQFRLLGPEFVELALLYHRTKHQIKQLKRKQENSAGR